MAMLGMLLKKDEREPVLGCRRDETWSDVKFGR